jgi:hypothetical protein
MHFFDHIHTIHATLFRGPYVSCAMDIPFIWSITVTQNNCPSFGLNAQHASDHLPLLK